jgi:hypothetical protein
MADFNTLCSIMDRIRQMIRLEQHSKPTNYTQVLSTEHSTTEYVFFSSAHGDNYLQGR